MCRALVFDPDAAASELKRAVAALDRLARDTLVLGDRLYCTAAFFEALHEHGCWGVVRRNHQLGLRKQQRLRKRRIQGGLLEDWLVRAGSGGSTPAQTLRYIRWRRGGTRYEVLTNVLTPARLSAEEALDLYPYRWRRIERMFFDLKEVLNLNRVYAANPNAVATQVYAPRSCTTACASPRATRPRNWAGRLNGSTGSLDLFYVSMGQSEPKGGISVSTNLQETVLRVRSDVPPPPAVARQRRVAHVRAPGRGPVHVSGRVARVPEPKGVRQPKRDRPDRRRPHRVAHHEHGGALVPWRRRRLRHLDNQSKLPYNLLGGIEWRFVPSASAMVAFRYLKIDLEKGSGARTFNADIEMFGPFLAVGFYF